MSKLDQITAALGDPACESVTVKYLEIDQKESQSIDLFSSVNQNNFLSSFGEFLTVESFAVNHRKFDDLGVGDLVSSEDGHGVIENIFTLNRKVYGYQILINDNVEDFARHELVLLQKAKP